MARTEPWPFGCQYFDARTMDAWHICGMIANDTAYIDPRNPWYLECLCLNSGSLTRHSSRLRNQNSTGIFSPNVYDSDVAVVRVRQKRHYLHQDTHSAVSVDKPTWTGILETFDVLPSFIELLHSNNGGSLKHVTYSAATCDGLQPTQVKPTAFHIGYKIGDWGNDEAAIYGRIDFSTARVFILMLGTDGFIDLNVVERLLQTAPQANLFDIVFNLLSSILANTEEIRWVIDYATQAHEARTGIASLHQPQISPLTPEQLKYDQDLRVTLDFAHNLEFGSGQARLMLQELSTHIAAFRELCGSVNNQHNLDGAILENLVDACNMKIQLARCQQDQIGRLIVRLNAQDDITKVLMSQRDTKLTIDIADAALSDSQAMRNIARVTMTFLPATFMCTFFSMVFFHTGDQQPGALTVNSEIWIYVVITVPLTILTAVWYFRPKEAWKWALEHWRKIERRRK